MNKSKRSHVGFYLIGEGVRQLEETQKKKEKVYRQILRRLIQYQGKLYIMAIILNNGSIFGCSNQLFFQSNQFK